MAQKKERNCDHCMKPLGKMTDAEFRKRNFLCDGCNEALDAELAEKFDQLFDRADPVDDEVPDIVGTLERFGAL